MSKLILLEQGLQGWVASGRMARGKLESRARGVKGGWGAVWGTQTPPFLRDGAIRL